MVKLGGCKYFFSMVLTNQPKLAPSYDLSQLRAGAPRLINLSYL